MRDHKDGVLFLVVGSSGAGKDTLIEYAKNSLRGDRNFLFPIRYITRPQVVGTEVHRSLSQERFKSCLKANKFALYWEAHGFSYGIDREIKGSLKKGKNVIVNVSRSVIDFARRVFPRVVVIEVQASKEVLERRLKERQREAAGEIRARMERSSTLPVLGPGVITVQNNGALEMAGEEFLAILREIPVAFETVTWTDERPGRDHGPAGS